MVAAFSATFRVVLPDTPDFLVQALTRSTAHDEHELDAMDSLAARLRQRQVIHRMSDREAMINVSQVVRNILLQDDPGGQSGTPRPSLYAVNCAKCHLVGGSQLASAGIELSVSFLAVQIHGALVCRTTATPPSYPVLCSPRVVHA